MLILSSPGCNRAGRGYMPRNPRPAPWVSFGTHWRQSRELIEPGKGVGADEPRCEDVLA
jgi:hypothetical protein